MARDRFQDLDFVPIRLRLIGRRETNARQGIIVETQSDGLQRISDLRPSFMAMHYPILFPFGEDGFYIGIPYFKNEGRKKKTKQETITMREHYAYRIQHWRNGRQKILCGGQLFQQFIVDAYAAIEEERLRFICNRQSRS